MSSNIVDAPEPWRPALGKLTADVRDHAGELLDGLDGERRALEWTQETIVRTLGTFGRVDTAAADPLAELIRGLQGPQGTFLGALVRPAARDPALDLGEDAAKAFRRRFLTTQVVPAYQQAFRELRTDATEYVDDAGDDDRHDPDRQRHIAMRPSLSEIDQWQARALARLLDGFDDTDAVIDWAPDVVQATHGELGKAWTHRCLSEPSTLRVLTDASDAAERPRRLFAASHLLPEYREGVRVLWGRSGEVASAEREEKGVEFA